MQNSGSQQGKKGINMALEDRIRLPLLNFIHRRPRLLNMLEEFVETGKTFDHHLCARWLRQVDPAGRFCPDNRFAGLLVFAWAGGPRSNLFFNAPGLQHYRSLS